MSVTCGVMSVTCGVMSVTCGVMSVTCGVMPDICACTSKERAEGAMWFFNTYPYYQPLTHNLSVVSLNHWSMKHTGWWVFFFFLDTIPTVVTEGTQWGR